MPFLGWQLYVIVDRAAVGRRSVEEVAASAVLGGADVIQFRDKKSPDHEVNQIARRLLLITKKAGVALVLNDRVEIARQVGADGVHVGQEDWPIARVREAVGNEMIVGKSTHSLEQALAAQAEGASYIGFGPLFATPTKPGYGSIGLGLIPKAASVIDIPMVCIGGIDEANVEAVLQAGGRCIAVVRAVCAAENPEASAKALKRKIAQFGRASAPESL